MRHMRPLLRCGFPKADHDDVAALGRDSQFQDVRKVAGFGAEQEESATAQLVAAYQVGTTRPAAGNAW